MLFRQLFHRDTSTYTYLIASREGGGGALIDPVKEDTDRYMRLLEELNITLLYAIDTHVHADHVTALGGLRERTGCTTIMGEFSGAGCVSRLVKDGDIIDIDGIELQALSTPGHTDDSFSYRLADRVFTGLVIRGTGRTDFQSGDAHAQYDSLFGKLLQLPEDTLVYPGHDYRGNTMSTIGEEKRHNPRLQVAGTEEYATLMNGLNLPDPRYMDVAVPANLKCGNRAA